MRPTRLSAYINNGKEVINTIFIKISTFGAQNAAIDEKGNVFVWGIK